MFRCSGCDLTVDAIPRFKVRECSKDIQHYFEEIYMKATKVNNEIRRGF